MKKDVRTIEMFRRLGEEVPGIEVKWSSYVETDRNNVIHAELQVKRGLLCFTNHAGKTAYGIERTLGDLQKAEYLQRHRVVRSILGFHLFLETFL